MPGVTLLERATILRYLWLLVGARQARGQPIHSRLEPWWEAAAAVIRTWEPLRAGEPALDRWVGLLALPACPVAADGGWDRTLIAPPEVCHASQV